MSLRNDLAHTIAAQLAFSGVTITEEQAVRAAAAVDSMLWDQGAPTVCDGKRGKSLFLMRAAAAEGKLCGSSQSNSTVQD
jgi:hypothetical protein